VRAFAKAEKVELTRPHAEVITAMAHALFEESHREEPYFLYKILLEQGFQDNLIRTRHAQYFVSEGQYQTAIALLEALRKEGGLGAWGLRSLAFSYMETNRADEAEPILESIVKRNPHNVAFARDYLSSLSRQRKDQQVRAYLAKAREQLKHSDFDDLQIAYWCETADSAALLAFLEENPGSGTAAIRNDLLKAIIDNAYKVKDYPTALRLIDQYVLRFKSNNNILLCRLNIAFARQDWPAAESLLAETKEDAFRASAELRVKRFEYFCFVGDLRSAAEQLKALEPLSQLPRQFLPAVMRYYAETKEWQKAYELGMDLLASDFDFRQSGYLLFRAIRKTGNQGAALRRIEQIKETNRTASLKRLRAIILEDIVDKTNALDTLLKDPQLSDLKTMRQRLFFKKLVLQGKSKRKVRKRHAIYFCTNADYLCAALVSLMSLIDSNRDLVALSDIFIVVDDESFPLAKRVATKLSRKVGIKIELKKRADILPEKLDLKEKYGIFTGGQSLSEAAYYRIFFAKKLLDERKYERALYIDSDTIIRSSLHEMFDAAAQAPLLARLEEPRPEVAAAIRTHDLPAGQYFNSGILLFDLKNRQLAAALDRTIKAITSSGDKLIFQDQCALNIGFKGAFQSMDAKYNYFIKPDGDDLPSEAAIIHYLDRPKPWDPAYPGEACRHWFASWHKMAIHIGSEDAMTLYKSSNRS
jgi:lipopolysaccharide biosynthesis glycosyltransferase